MVTETETETETPTETETTLTAQLKTEHVALLACLDHLKQLGIASAQGQAEVQRARKLLIAHLQREDEAFYSVLRQAAEHDSGLKIMLETFAVEMQQITSDVMAFFDDHEGHQPDTPYAEALGRLCARVHDRITREEAVLVPLFDRARARRSSGDAA